MRGGDRTLLAGSLPRLPRAPRGVVGRKWKDRFRLQDFQLGVGAWYRSADFQPTRLFVLSGPELYSCVVLCCLAYIPLMPRGGGHFMQNTQRTNPPARADTPHAIYRGRKETGTPYGGTYVLYIRANTQAGSIRSKPLGCSVPACRCIASRLACRSGGRRDFY